jgi:hypothetical protein
MGSAVNVLKMNVRVQLFYGLQRIRLASGLQQCASRMRRPETAGGVTAELGAVNSVTRVDATAARAIDGA